MLSHPLTLTITVLSVSSLTHLQCTPVSQPLHMPEFQPNLFCSLLLYPLGFCDHPHHSSASTVLHFFTPTQGLLHPSSHKIVPYPTHNLSSICDLPPPNLLVLIQLCPAAFAVLSPFSLCWSISGCVRLCFHHSCLRTTLSLFSSTLIYYSPSSRLFCLPIQCSSRLCPTAKSGKLPSPSECCLGDMKPCQLPMSSLQHNTVIQADASTNTNITCTFLHIHI